MEKYIVKFFLFLFFLFVWTEQIYAQELKTGYYPDGNIRYRGYFVDGKPIGEMTRYYPDGQIKAIMTNREDTTDVILYSKKGDFTSTGRYIARKKEGSWKYYQGERLMIVEQYTAGQLNGSTVRYFNSGNKAEEKNWKQGKLEGVWKLYYDNNEIRLEASYTDGRLNGMVKSYSLKGILRAEGKYCQGYKEGKWLFYDDQGNLQKEVRYQEGLPEHSEELELEESRRLDDLLGSGEKIPDPAAFMDDPDAYMRLTGME